MTGASAEAVFIEGGRPYVSDDNPLYVAAKDMLPPHVGCVNERWDLAFLTLHIIGGVLVADLTAICHHLEATANRTLLARDPP